MECVECGSYLDQGRQWQFMDFRNNKKAPHCGPCVESFCRRVDERLQWLLDNQADAVRKKRVQ